MFTALCVALYYVIPKKYRWIVLLCASTGFYAIVCLKYISFIIITVLSTFFGGLALEKYIKTSTQYIKSQKGIWSKEEKDKFKAKAARNKKLICAAVLLFNFGILAFLKYYGMFAQTANLALQYLGWEMPKLGLILPLGISFYTFQSMGYIIDIYRKKYAAERNIAKFALFVSFYPQIVQGPISMYSNLAPQLYGGNRFNFDNIKQGMLMIAWGFFKKLIIADRLVIAISTVTADYTKYNGSAILLAALIYAVQLYADFSGGIDISRGVAQLFGINLAENFKRPYFSRSISEYWRRWHITLGAWLREYLFYPIAMSKAFQKFGKSVKKRFGMQMGKVLPVGVASLITFVTIGVWHGAAWKYVAFGLWNGIIIMISTLLEPQFKTVKQKLHIKDSNILFIAFQMVRTFIIVLVGYYFDIAEGATAAVHMMYWSVAGFDASKLFSEGMLKTLHLTLSDVIVAAVALLIVLIVSIVQERSKEPLRQKICKHNFVLQTAAFAFLVFATLIFGVYGPGTNPADFVYMQF